MKYRIRFNKSRGQAGRGTMDHVWRVFEGDKEYLLKHVEINVPSRSELEVGGLDWNIVCDGRMVIDRETSTAHIYELIEVPA
jgi:hypothetical protein